MTPPGNAATPGQERRAEALTTSAPKVSTQHDPGRVPGSAATECGALRDEVVRPHPQGHKRKCRCILTPGHMTEIPWAGHSCTCNAIWGRMRKPNHVR